MVTSHYADASRDWPVDLLPYIPQDLVSRENARILKQNQSLLTEKQRPLLTFHPKLALELVDLAEKRKISFIYVLVDAWYGNCPGFTNWKRNKSYTSPRYTLIVVSTINLMMK